MKLQMESPVGARTIFNGREYDYFAGTGYLGLQSHPAVVQAARQAVERYGLSTATSRGGYGEHPIYAELEREACAYFAAEKVIYFPTGYLGCAILAQATGSLFDHIFIDASAHYSLWDAAQATNRPITPFHHRNPEHLAECLRDELRPHQRPLILSDGVFPVSGAIAPLPDYLPLVKSYNGILYVDDAHGVGVLGENGRGVMEYFGIQEETCRSPATLAKALGGYGGLIYGKANWVDSIEQNSRICAGASPPPLVIAAASAKALAIARAAPDLRQQLWKNVSRARTGLRALGWELEDNPVPIICLGMRDGVSLVKIKTELFKQGIAVEYTRSYSSAPAGGALRIAIFTTHTANQIDRLVETLSRSI
jgi:8-amino-7-oxononanoate synthase